MGGTLNFLASISAFPNPQMLNFLNCIAGGIELEVSYQLNEILKKLDETLMLSLASSNNLKVMESGAW